MIRQSIGGGTNAGRIVSMPAPVGGWNTRDSIADMGVKDAVFLDNFFPRNSDVMMRKGRQLLATLPPGLRIRTLLGYKSNTGAAQQFAATQTGIYNITNPSVPVLATTSTKADWEYVNATTSGGHFILACNGQDRMKLYDGTTWTDLDAASTPAVTGVLTQNVTNISKYKTRVVLCQKNSLSFWYLPTNAIAGVATEFPLQSIFSKGGYLVATAEWTIDGGNGPGSYFVAVTSEGEVVVYIGDDVAASNFQKVGVFQLPAPSSKRCFKQLSDDMLLMTKGAIYPLSKALGRGLNDRRLTLTDKIDKAYVDYSERFSGLFGWEMAFFPEAAMLLVNIPTLDYPAFNATYSEQFVINTMTQSWCRFQAWYAETMSTFDGKLYSALGNQVWQCWTGTSDDGANIVAKGKTAFNPLRTAGNKHVSMLRPLIQSPASVTVQLGIDVDYRDNVLTTSSSSYLASLSRWDSAIWNSARWNGSSSILANWATVNSPLGRVVSVRLRVESNSSTMSWIATDLIVTDGGYI